MVTILLQKIIELLTGFFGDFIEWANTVGDKIASIKDNTDSLPDIKDNTDSIKNNTSSIAASNSLIQGYSLLISNRATNIDNNVTAIKNNVGSIATSSGTTAAFAEDIANNTLDMDNRLVTIGSDTTQIRADSGNIAADVAEIKDTLGLYLYNTIVTEDAEGYVAFCDTDLKDYLQEAKVTIPADAGGITGINFYHAKKNLFNWNLVTPFNSNVSVTKSYNSITTTNNNSYTINALYGSDILFKPGTYTFSVKNKVSTSLNLYKNGVYYATAINTNNKKGTVVINAEDTLTVFYNVTANNTVTVEELMIECGSNATTFEEYETPTNYSISFTSITDGAEIDLLTGLIKINTSPVTYDSITPIAIRTYKGVNNIYSDIGTTSVTYRETLKHYLKKQEA